MARNFQRPNYPYTPESLQNCNRFQNTTRVNDRSIPDYMFDWELGYIIDSLRILSVDIDNTSAGTLPGTANPGNQYMIPQARGDGADGGFDWVLIQDRNVMDASLSGSKLFPGTITARELADGGIPAAKYGAKSIPTSALDDFVITNDKLGPQVITQEKMAADSVGGSQIKVQSISSYHINPQAVTEPKIKNSNVTLIKLAQEVLDCFLPIGSVVQLSGTTAPPSIYVECNGQLLLRADYPALFAAVGTTYGASNSTNFRVPDMRGRTPVGIGVDGSTGGRITAATAPNITLGGTGGSETHTLTINEMPSHTHNDYWNTFYRASGGDPFNAVAEVSTPYQRPTLPTGGGQPHNNMQPFIFLRYYIRAK